MQQPFFIALEGVDGSGKTTTAAHLAERLNGVYVKTPSKRFQQIWESFDQPLKSNVARFFFYTTSLCETAEEIRRRLNDGLTVVADRWYASTLLYHEQLLGMNLSTTIGELLLPHPDFTFILQPPLPTILHRLAMRERGHDYTLEQDPTFIAAIYEKYRAFNGGIHIDPGDQSVNEVVSGLIQTYLFPSSIAEAKYA